MTHRSPLFKGLCLAYRYGRLVVRKRCAGPGCETVFEARRDAAKWCSERCKRRGHRRPDAVKSPSLVALSSTLEPETTAPTDGPITASTRSELVTAGRDDSALGLVALLAASRLDALAGSETGAGVKALIEAHRVALGEAVRDAEGAGDPMEFIRRSAALKLLPGGA